MMGIDYAEGIKASLCGPCFGVTAFTWDGSFNIHIEKGWFLEKVIKADL